MPDPDGMDEVEAALATYKPNQPGMDEAEAALATYKPKTAHETELPVQHIEGDPDAGAPWYTKMLHSLKRGSLPQPGKYDSQFELPPAAARQTLQNIDEGIPDAAVGAAHGLTSGLADDAVGLISSAAGQGIRDSVEAARTRSPGAFSAGDLGGAYTQTAGVAPAASLGGRVAQGAAIGGASAGARAFGDSNGADDRGQQALDAAETGAVVGGTAPLVAAGLSAAGDKLGKVASKLRTHIFMTPGQRAAYTTVHGAGSLESLSGDMKSAGLYKKPWYSPLTASRISDNADNMLASEGPNIGAIEDRLTGAGANPDVPITGVTDKLRSRASDLGRLVDKNAPRDARYFTDQANRLAQPEAVAVPGTVTAPPSIPEWARENRAVPPRQPGLPGVEMGAPSQASPQTAFHFAPDATPRTTTDAQLTMDLPRAPRPEPFIPGNSTGEQLPMDLSVPARQRVLALQGGQGGLPMPQGELPAAPVAESPQLSLGGDAQQYTPPGLTPRGDYQALPGSRDVLKPEAQQLSMPAQQLTIPMPRTPKPSPFSPGDIGGEQVAMPYPNSPLRAQGVIPGTASPEQLAMELPHRSGPQFTQTPVEASGTIERESMPLDQALENKRDMASRINWTRNPNAPKTSYGEEQARKTTWGGLKDSIQETLTREAAAGRINPDDVAALGTANKNYSTAATAYDPAMKMAEKNSQGASARDIALGTAMSGHGGLAMLAAKTGAGLLPATEARTAAILGGTLRGAGAGAGAAAANPGTVGALIGSAKASAGPDATETDIKRDANDKLKILRRRATMGDKP